MWGQAGRQAHLRRLPVHSFAILVTDLLGMLALDRTFLPGPLNSRCTLASNPPNSRYGRTNCLDLTGIPTLAWACKSDPNRTTSHACPKSTSLSVKFQIASPWSRIADAYGSAIALCKAELNNGARKLIHWIVPAVTFLFGVVATWMIARREFHRPKLTYTLLPAAQLHSKDVGSSFSMTLGGHKVDNLCVFTLEISLKGRADVAKRQVVDDNKPTLYFQSSRASMCEQSNTTKLASEFL